MFHDEDDDTGRVVDVSYQASQKYVSNFQLTINISVLRRNYRM